jgi:hypothetical protein
MPKGERGRRPDEREYLRTTQVERLCAAVKQSRKRSDVLFLGWDIDGKPVATTNKLALSEQASDSFGFSDTARKRLDEIVSHGEIEPVIFVAKGRAVDRQDQDGEKVDDVLSYFVTDTKGDSAEIQVTERDVLEAILENRIEWEDVNPDSMLEMDDEVLTPKTMYTVVIKDFKNKHKHYALMFKPVLEGESNEIAFKQFVAKTIGTLLKIDQRQAKDDKKGYSTAVGRANRGDGNKDSGLAYDIFAFMADEGWMNVDGEKLEQLRLDSVGKGLLGQALLLMRENGWLTEDFMRSATNTTVSMDVGSMSVGELMQLVNVVRSTVERSFRNSRY